MDRDIFCRIYIFVQIPGLAEIRLRLQKPAVFSGDKPGGGLPRHRNHRCALFPPGGAFKNPGELLGGAGGEGIQGEHIPQHIPLPGADPDEQLPHPVAVQIPEGIVEALIVVRVLAAQVQKQGVGIVILPVRLPQGNRIGKGFGES